MEAIVYGYPKARLVIRMALIAVTVFFVRVQIWFLATPGDDGMSYQRGLFAPSLLAFAALLGTCATFERRPRLTRSERIVADARRRSRKDYSRVGSSAFILIATAIIFAAFAASFAESSVPTRQ